MQETAAVNASYQHLLEYILQIFILWHVDWWLIIVSTLIWTNREYSFPCDTVKPNTNESTLKYN